MESLRILQRVTRGPFLSITFYCSGIVCTRFFSSCSLSFREPINSHYLEPLYEHTRVFKAVLLFHTIRLQELTEATICGGPCNDLKINKKYPSNSERLKELKRENAKKNSQTFACKPG